LRHCKKYRIRQNLSARRNRLTACFLWSMLLFFSNEVSAVTISATSDVAPGIITKQLLFNGTGIGYAQLFCSGAPEISVTFTTSNGVRQGNCNGSLVGDTSGHSYYRTTTLSVIFTNWGEGKSVTLFYGLTDNSGDQSLWTLSPEAIPAGVTATCSIDVNTVPTIPALHPANDVDIMGIISNPVGITSTITFKPGSLSAGMQKGILALDDGRVNGYYAINNEPVDSSGVWVASSDSNPRLHVRSVRDGKPGEMTGFMTATISCP